MGRRIFTGKLIAGANAQASHLTKDGKDWAKLGYLQVYSNASGVRFRLSTEAGYEVSVTGAYDLQIVSYGNAVGIYVIEPPGNQVEVYPPMTKDGDNLVTIGGAERDRWRDHGEPDLIKGATIFCSPGCDAKGASGLRLEY